MTTPHTDGHWYKDAIFYEMHVRSFQDGNGDGIGDFVGLAQRIPYLRRLGVDCVWLLPFCASPLRDDGYDVSDYRAIHPDYGTVADFRGFLDAAHAAGIRVIADLVLNHTSDQHAWFKAARADPRSPFRDYYVWSDHDTGYANVPIIFRDTERSNWTWDSAAKQYFWHRFFSHQPDLNYDNPQVRREILDVAAYWLEMGLDGFRCDAVPYLVEREGTVCESLPETHAFLKELRALVEQRFPGRVLLAEANLWPADLRDYFSSGDEFHMAFNFPLMPRMYMALRREDREPIIEILRKTPEIPDSCQWALFLRNHDELTLTLVSDPDREFLESAYANDPRMKLNLGIRRRLAPILENGRRRIELMNAILFSLPGSPIIYYGDEIGMGDNIWLGDRHGVRTPMQWSDDRNGGFSRAPSAQLFLPVIQDPPFGYQAVNVEAQERVQTSLLSWMRRLITIRKRSRALGRGAMHMLEPANKKVFAHVRTLGDEAVLCVSNLSRYVQPVELDLSPWDGMTPVELFGQTPFPTIAAGRPYTLALGPHGFIWFALERRS